MGTTCVVTALLMNAPPLTAGNHQRTVTVGGLERTYRVHVPKSWDGQRPVPVVLAFHGGATDAEVMRRFSGLDEKSDEAGFVVVYPNGTGLLERVRTWNAGNCCGYAMRRKIDDVAFVRALLDDLGTIVRVDRKRVYATGISNGAMIAYRLASELSDRIAAIAPIAGAMATETCRPRRAVSVIHFHGDDDKFAPFAGGKGDRSLSTIDFLSVEHSIRAWVQANGCPEVPAVTKEPDRFDDGTTVTRQTYGPGNEGSQVVLYIVHGGGHTWPGRPAPERVLGKATRDISANDLMWEFFQRHPMP